MDLLRVAAISAVLCAAGLSAPALAQPPVSGPQAAPPKGPAPHDAPAPAVKSRITVVTVASGLQNPWSLAFLPDGRMLVTERAGRMRYVDKQGNLSGALNGVPVVVAGGQAGLFDVVLAPDFATSKAIFFTYYARTDGGNTVHVARATLGADRLSDLKVIYRAPAVNAPGLNIGSRLVFARDGTLFVTIGDRFTMRDKAQTLDNALGKTLRINADGSIPKDNPFVGRQGALPEIWNYGHRNQQAAALEPNSGVLWTAEHGPRGGDELNIEKKGANYGWPAITYGIDYSGAAISDKAAAPGMDQPLYYWNPSPALSGMAFYTGYKYPNWRGDVFIGALGGQALIRLDLQNGKVVGEERLLRDEIGERIRDVRQGPDGFLYLLTDENAGRILRLEVKK
jgi:aldose sugar dehydrogenase